MDKLDKDTFFRFKFIKNLINKYPIINFDLTEINNIKNNYIEYKPSFKKEIGNPQLESNTFIEKDILNKILKFNNYILISEEYFTLKIYYDNISDLLINRIYSIIKLFQKLYGNKNINSINIILLEQKREITTKIIGASNVNGGYIIGSNDKSDIFVFRKEEVIKVLIHELCHFYKLDCQKIDRYQNNIFKKINIKTPDYLSLNEVFTEYIAILHHTAIISFYINISPLLIYHYEKIWSLYQVAKILKHYNFNKFEDLYTKELIQETNVFSYYILKFFILYKRNNKCSYKNLQDILNDKEIINIINENINNNKYDKNLRLTLFELKD